MMRRNGVQKLLIWSALALWVCAYMTSGFAPSETNWRARVDAFVIDSSSSMTKSRRQQIGVFEDVSHAEAVRSRLQKAGHGRPTVIDAGVAGAEAIDLPKYLAALQRVDQHADAHPERKVVVNLSLGSRSGDAEEASLIEKLLAKGVILVAAAGNDGAERVAFPAAYPGVIAVGATAKSQPRLAGYSNRGPEIDILAPGIFERREERIVGNMKYGRQLLAGGTSFAAPRVTGTIVDMLELANGREIDVAHVLRTTATPLPSSDAFRRGHAGAGLLDEHAAVRVVRPSVWWPRLALLLSFVLLFAARADENKLGQIGTLAVVFLILLLFPAMATYLHANRSGFDWRLADPRILDGVVIAGLVMLSASISVGLPYVVRVVARRYVLWSYIPRTVQRLARAEEYTGLIDTINRSDKEERVAGLGALAKLREDATPGLVQWLVGLRRGDAFGESEVRLVDGFAKQPPSLITALLERFVAETTDASEVPNLIDQASYQTLLAHVGANDLRQLVAKMRPDDIRSALTKCDDQLRASALKVLVPRRVESLTEEVLRDRLERIEAILVVHSTGERWPIWMLSASEMRSHVSQMTLDDQASLLGDTEFDLEVSGLSEIELRVAVNSLSGFDLRSFCSAIDLSLLADPLRRVPIAAVIGRLGWGKRPEVTAALEQVKGTDPLAGYLGGLISGDHTYFRQPPTPGERVSYGEGRVAAVIVGLVVFCVFVLWLFRV